MTSLGLWLCILLVLAAGAVLATLLIRRPAAGAAADAVEGAARRARDRRTRAPAPPAPARRAPAVVLRPLARVPPLAEIKQRYALQPGDRASVSCATPLQIGLRVQVGARPTSVGFTVREAAADGSVDPDRPALHEEKAVLAAQWTALVLRTAIGQTAPPPALLRVDMHLAAHPEAPVASLLVAPACGGAGGDGAFPAVAPGLAVLAPHAGSQTYVRPVGAPGGCRSAAGALPPAILTCDPSYRGRWVRLVIQDRVSGEALSLPLAARVGSALVRLQPLASPAFTQAAYAARDPVVSVAYALSVLDADPAVTAPASEVEPPLTFCCQWITRVETFARRCDTAADCGLGEGCLHGRCSAACVDADCPPGEACNPVDGACLPACATAADCADPGAGCVAGVCTACAAAEDCRSGERCSAAGACYEPCAQDPALCGQPVAADAPISAFGRCTEANVCFGPEVVVGEDGKDVLVPVCGGDYDCGFGRHCAAGLCAPNAADYCSPPGGSATYRCAPGKVCMNVAGGSEYSCVAGCAAAADCPENAVCGPDGVCVACPSGKTACGEACVDLQKDSTNCGGCAQSCPAGQTCARSECLPVCATSADCDAGRACALDGVCRPTCLAHSDCAEFQCLGGICQPCIGGVEAASASPTPSSSVSAASIGECDSGFNCNNADGRCVRKPATGGA